MAQPSKKSTEVGLFLGGSYYIGDLSPLGHFNQFTQPAGGILVRHNINPRFAVRASVLVGSVQGADSISNSTWQKQRNQSFRSDVYEFSGQLEFNFLDFEIGNDYKRFSHYIFIGLGGFRYNPQGLVNDTWVDLQPLGTEGQGLPNGPDKRKYKLTQLSVPVGVGVKIGLSKYITLGFEWGMRKTFTDYIDDVSTRYYDPAVLAAKRGANAAHFSDKSIGNDPNFNNIGRQRGNPTTKDWYNFSGVTLTVKFKEGRKKCPGVYK